MWLCECGVGHSVCKVMAVRGYRSGRLGVALTWCIRANVSHYL